MKIIETSYAGCLFRSRTEARWAVFFDALGLRWEYEKEGFELPSGRYLPDFWLPDLKAWVEVKGTHPTPDERRAMADLIAFTKRPGTIVSGAPDIEKFRVLFRLTANYQIGPQRLRQVEAAVTAARSARFEYGAGAHRQRALGPRRDIWDRERMAYPMAVGDGTWCVAEADDGGGGIWADCDFTEDLANSYATLIAMVMGHDLGAALELEAA